MTRFKLGQRVFVRRCERSAGGMLNFATPVPGRVWRLMMSGNACAWVALDKRLDAPGVHPFPADDPVRGTLVTAWPEHCDGAA